MLYEYRIHEPLPGRLADLQARHRDYNMKLFERHGMKILGYWMATTGDYAGMLVYAVAFEDAEHNDTFEVSGDVSSAVAEELSKALADTAADKFHDHVGMMPEYLSIINFESPEDYHADQALFGGLLANALDNVSFEAAAEAILIHAGKWAPDTDLPEML